MQLQSKAKLSLLQQGVDMSSVHNVIVTTAIAFAAGLGFNASAQMSGQPPQGMPGGPGPMGMQAPMQGGRPLMNDAKREAHRAERHQKHLDEMKVFLQLQPSQEGAWNSFASVMKTPMKRPTPPAQGEIEKMTTPERIDKMMATKAERDAEMTKRMNATKAFYATLTPAQQKVFDTHTQKFLNRGPMGHHGKMHP
jgi:periplasmic protein CpxP/Spy